MKDLNLEPTAILQPLLKHRFRLTLACEDKEVQKLITLQVTDFSVDYVSKLATLKIEQNSGTSGLHNTLIEMAASTKPTHLRVEMIDRDEQVVQELNLWVKISKHLFELSYRESQAATHDITFNIVSIFAK